METYISSHTYCTLWALASTSAVSDSSIPTNGTTQVLVLRLCLIKAKCHRSSSEVNQVYNCHMVFTFENQLLFYSILKGMAHMACKCNLLAGKASSPGKFVFLIY